MEAPDIIYTDGKNTCAPAPVFSNTDGNVKYIRADLTEQPEVDLEKSRNLIRNTLNGVTRLGSLCDDQTIEHAVDNLINELGLNARKEESK